MSAWGCLVGGIISRRVRLLEKSWTQPSALTYTVSKLRSQSLGNLDRRQWQCMCASSRTGSDGSPVASKVLRMRRILALFPTTLQSAESSRANEAWLPDTSVWKVRLTHRAFLDVALLTTIWARLLNLQQQIIARPVPVRRRVGMPERT